MADLDKIFQIELEYFDFHSFEFCRDFFKITLWIGTCLGTALSEPTKNDLSLNDYIILTFKITDLYGSLLNIEQMNEIFGFDLYDFVPPDGSNPPSYAHFAPKDVLIKILKRCGAISDIPDDAGDGE